MNRPRSTAVPARRSRLPLPALLLPLALAACAGTGLAIDDRLERHYAALTERGYVLPPRPEGFTICRGYTCRFLEPVALSGQEWQGVLAAFSPAPPDAPAERRAVARAVAHLEQLVGDKTGTAGDQGGTFAGALAPGQLDCVDEATNTTAYLTMLRDAGVIRFHSVQPTAWRGYFLVNGWPHTSAVLRETASGVDYVVDAWFHPNGRPPEILPVARWEAGWEPE